MESLLRLNKEQTQRKIARQKRQRRLFWVIGLILIAVQVIVAVRVSRTKPVAITQAAALTTTLGASTNQAASTDTMTSETYTETPPTPILQPATHTPIPATPLPSPSVTHITMPIETPPVTASITQPTYTSMPTQTAQARRSTFISTGYGALKETPAPTQSPSGLTLLAPPEQVTEQTFELSGLGQPGKAVSVLYNHSIIAQVDIDKNGNWRTDIPTAPLIRGDNAFVVRTTDAGVSAVDTSDVSDDYNQLVFFKTTFTPWWLDTPLRLQASLGEGYACAPTVLGMAMDFYHHTNDNHPAPATVELVQALAKKGFVSGYGADAQMVCDLAITYGYSHSFFYHEWSQAHLRQMLDAGHPVIANVRVGLSTDGYGHSVLVIGLSHDGQRVMLIDPAQGMVESSWAQFDRSWASFGPPYRHGTVVMP